MNNLETVQTMYAAFGRGDVPGILAHMADNIDMNNSSLASAECPWNADFSGKSRVPGFFKALADNLEFTRFEPRDFVASGNHVVVRIAIESVVKKNGKRVQNDVVHFWTLNDQNKVTQYRHFGDSAAELAAWRG